MESETATIHHLQDRVTARRYVAGVVAAVFLVLSGGTVAAETARIPILAPITGFLSLDQLHRPVARPDHPSACTPRVQMRFAKGAAHIRHRQSRREQPTPQRHRLPAMTTNYHFFALQPKFQGLTSPLA